MNNDLGLKGDQLSFAFRGDQFLPDHIHDSYIRCSQCGIKYLMIELRLVAVSKYLCKFCITQLGGLDV